MAIFGKKKKAPSSPMSQAFSALGFAAAPQAQPQPVALGYPQFQQAQQAQAGSYLARPAATPAVSYQTPRPDVGTFQRRNSGTAMMPAPASNGAAPDLHQICPGIWLGSCKAVNADILRRLGIRYVVNTGKELKTHPTMDWVSIKNAGIIVMHVQWEDTTMQPIFPSKELNDAITWVDQVVASGNSVLINCAMGRSRSTSLVIAYMMMRHGNSYDQALATIQSKRPIAQPNPNFEEQLRHMHRSIQAKNSHAPSQGMFSPSYGTYNPSPYNFVY